jgi:hypothetical protein
MDAGEIFEARYNPSQRTALKITYQTLGDQEDPG